MGIIKSVFTTPATFVDDNKQLYRDSKKFGKVKKLTRFLNLKKDHAMHCLFVINIYFHSSCVCASKHLFSEMKFLEFYNEIPCMPNPHVQIN